MKTKPINLTTGEPLTYSEVYTHMNSGIVMLDAKGEPVEPDSIAELYEAEIIHLQASATTADSAPVDQIETPSEPQKLETQTVSPVIDAPSEPVAATVSALPVPAAPAPAPTPVLEPAPAVATEVFPQPKTVAGYEPLPYESIPRGDVKTADIAKPEALALLTSDEADGLRQFAKIGDFRNFAFAMVHFLSTKPAA